jgi:hypothetical protein
MTLAERVARRYLLRAFRYVPKEKKKSKVERLSRYIRQGTGLSKTTAEGIADTLVRSGRDIEALAPMKGWPIEDGRIIGPTGNVSLAEVRGQI